MALTTDRLSLERYAAKVAEMAQSCPTLNAHNFLELVAIWQGRKRVVRLVVTDEMYAQVREFCQELGLVQGHSTRKQAPKICTSTGDTFTVSVDWDDPEGRFFVVLIGQTAEAVQTALECENGEVSFRDFGRLYGYPECCVEAYADIQEGADWIEAYLRRSPPHVPGQVAGNRLAVLFDGSTLLPDYFPCSLGCAATAELGEQYSRLLQEAGWGAHLDRVRRSLALPILIRSGTLLQLLDCHPSGNSIRYRAFRDWQISWRGALPAADPFFDADTLTICGETLRFFAAGNLLAEEPVGVLENRLLTFQ
jgi:hypothetical protein